MRASLTAAAVAALGTIGAPSAAQESVPEAALLAPVVRVSNCEAAGRWYGEALRMTQMMSRDLGAVHETMLAFPGAPSRPGIMLLCNAAADASPMRGRGGSRLIVGVADLSAIAARLDAAKVSHPAIHPPQAGVRVMTIADPDGNELELVERAPRG